MKKYALLALSLATIVGLVGLSSCSKDDPAPRQKVSFERSTQTISEGAGVVEVNVILDIAAGEDITVDFNVDGTALEGASSTPGTDYEITSGSDKVTIKKGQTKGIIELKIKDDTNYEGDETISFEITGTSSTNVDISDDNTIAITLTENDQQPTASFKSNTLSANEDDGIDVEIILDKPAGQDITLTYQILNEDKWLQQPIALSDVYAEANDIPAGYYDFGTYTDEENNFGEITIPKGEESVKLHVGFYTDFRLDDGETITIKLTGANGNAAAIATASTKNTTVITIAQQDGLDIELAWESVAADVNLYLFGAETAGNVLVSNQRYILGRSEYEQKSTDPANYAFEQVFLPFKFVGFVDNNNQPIDVNFFGVSANYRTGSVSPLDFKVVYAEYVDGDFVESTVKTHEGTYTTVNVNDPFNGGDQPAIIQTFGRSGDKYGAPTDITIPATGSRTRATGPGLKSFGKTTMMVNGHQIHLAGTPAELMKNPYNIKPTAALSSRRR